MTLRRIGKMVQEGGNLSGTDDLGLAEKNEFRHYDLVRAKHRTKGTVVGIVHSLKA